MSLDSSVFTDLRWGGCFAYLYQSVDPRMHHGSGGLVAGANVEGGVKISSRVPLPSFCLFFFFSLLGMGSTLLRYAFWNGAKGRAPIRQRIFLSRLSFLYLLRNLEESGDQCEVTRGGGGLHMERHSDLLKRRRGF